MGVFYDKKNGLEFIFDDKPIGQSSVEFMSMSDGPDDIDLDGLFSDEEIDELERMLNEGGAVTMPFVPDEDDDTNENYDRFNRNWGYFGPEDDDLGDWDDTDGPHPDTTKKWKEEDKAKSEKIKTCNHTWVKSYGLSRVYEDCKHCGMKKEDFERSRK